MFISNSLCIKENPNKQVKLNLQNFIFVFTLKKKIVMRVDITKNKKKNKGMTKDITSNAQSLSAALSFFILLGKKYIS